MISKSKRVSTYRQPGYKLGCRLFLEVLLCCLFFGRSLLLLYQISFTMTLHGIDGQEETLYNKENGGYTDGKASKIRQGIQRADRPENSVQGSDNNRNVASVECALHYSTGLG